MATTNPQIRSLGRPLDVAGAGQQPNILLIVADDLGADAIHIDDSGRVMVQLADASGPRPYRLPTFERMLKSGIHFSHAWAQPVCAPSRASLFTGIPPWRTTVGYAAGQIILPGTQTISGAPIRSLAEILGAAGYRSGIFGKWHLGEPVAGQKRTPTDWGWSRFEGITGGGLGPVTAEYGFPASQLSLCLDDLSKTDIDPEFADRAEELMQRRAEAQRLCREYLIEHCSDFVEKNPDIRYYVWGKDIEDRDAGIRRYKRSPAERTHLYAMRDQMFAAKDWIKQNSGRPWCVTLTVTLPHDPFHVPPRESYTVRFRNHDKPTRQEMFAAMVQSMDFYLGQLLDSPEVEVRDALKNTIIFFVGDNGTQDDDVDDRARDMFGQGRLPGGVEFSFMDKGSLIDDDLMDKGTHYIGGVHVPLLVADGGMLLGGAPCCLQLTPNPRAHRHTNRPVHISDIFRTCVELGGGEVPADTDAVSLLPYLQQQRTGEKRTYVFSQQFPPARKVFSDVPKFGSVSDGTYKLSCVRIAFVDGGAGDSYEYELSRLDSDPERIGALRETRLTNFHCDVSYMAIAQRLHAELKKHFLDAGGGGKPLAFPALPTGGPRVDIYILGSTADGMGPWIQQLRSTWKPLLERLRSEGNADLAGGVASYRDTADGDDLFTAHLTPTPSFNEIQRALDSWTTSRGGDLPEGQLFALYALGEMRGTNRYGWRSGTQKVLLWLGERPGHDPLHVPVLDQTTGLPTGQQFEVEIDMVMARLESAGVTVIPIRLGHTPGIDAAGQASRIAARTGGAMMNCPTPAQLADVMYGALQRVVVRGTAATHARARHVRLLAKSEVNGNPWASIEEFGLIIDGNPADRSSWQVRVDSEDKDNAGRNAIDGRDGTIWHTEWYWAAPPHPHWLSIDLMKDHEITGFQYRPRQDQQNGRIADYEFQISKDGQNWVTVQSGRFPNTSTEQTISLRSPIKAP